MNFSLRFFILAIALKGLLVQAQVPPKIYAQEVSRAQELVRQVDSEMEKLNIPERTEDPQVKNSVIAYNFDVENLLLILNDRIRNLHEDVFGWGDTDTEVRLSVENKIMNLDLDAEDLSDRDKLLLAKYAYLIMPGETSIGESGLYGQIYFILKEEVKKRATWTSYDSLALKPLTRQKAFKTGVLSTFSHSNSDGKRKRSQTGRRTYLEAQIWGPLNSNDIAELVLPNRFVVEDFLKPYVKDILTKVLAAGISISLLPSNSLGSADLDLLHRIRYKPGQIPKDLEIISVSEDAKSNGTPLVETGNPDDLKKSQLATLKTKILPFLEGAKGKKPRRCSSLL